MHLVPLKFKIGLRPNGHADHPDWYTLALAQNSVPANHMPHGWHYDKSSGHQEDNGGDSPLGMQWGMILVSRECADQAVAKWPDICTELTEAEAEDFYDNRHAAHIPDLRVNRDALSALNEEHKMCETIGGDLTECKRRMAAALDPDDRTQPGLSNNVISTWQRFVADKKLRLDEQVTAVER